MLLKMMSFRKNHDDNDIDKSVNRQDKINGSEKT